MGLAATKRPIDGLTTPVLIFLPWLAVSATALAGVVDVPELVRPGAIRPGADRQLAPPAPADDVLEDLSAVEIPAVIDRPLEIDDGTRIKVSTFELVGAVDRPAFAISTADVQAILDGKLAGQGDGFTVGRLQEIADEVTQYYRGHGLILAQAFVPVQTIDDGHVKIQVLEGLLGRVVTEGNEMYTDRVLQRPFDELLGKPVTKETMEAALLELTGYPGVSLFGVFQPGKQVGAADMVIKVQEEKRFAATVRWDNHGIRETGQNRYRLTGTINNLSGAGDYFTTTLQQTEQPANSFFWVAEYNRPLPWFCDTEFNVLFDRNQFDVGGEFRGRGIASDTRDLYLTLSKSYIRSRQRNLTGRLQIARKRVVNKVRGRKQSKDNIAPLLIGLDYDSVDAKWAGLNAAFFEFSHGFNDLFGAMGSSPGAVPPSRQGGNREFAKGKFDKALLSMSRLQALSPFSEKLRHHSLLFRGEVQWSDDLLVPIEQYSVGGPTNVRAFVPTERLFDRAFFTSIEWIVNAPGIADEPAFANRTWGELIQLSAFVDYAAGKDNSPLSNQDGSDNFLGAGGSLSVNNPNVWLTKLTIAWPVGTPRPRNNRDPQYWLDVNIFF